MFELNSLSNKLPREAKLELALLLHEQQRRKSRRLIDTYFPDEGEHRRELYPKHLLFFEAGKTDNERLFMAGNRTGKTIGGGYEVTTHMTGDYPHWWPGYVFDRPVKVLAAGDTSATTRDIIQDKLLGPWGEEGTGLIPGDLITGTTLKRNVAEAFEQVKVKSEFGGDSRIMLRSYDQGRKVFQGFEADIIWFDEEVPNNIYEEALIRTMTTGGLLIMTFTPVEGLTELVVSFMESAGLL